MQSAGVKSTCRRSSGPIKSLQSVICKKKKKKCHLYLNSLLLSFPNGHLNWIISPRRDCKPQGLVFATVELRSETDNYKTTISTRCCCKCKSFIVPLPHVWSQTYSSWEIRWQSITVCFFFYNPIVTWKPFHFHFVMIFLTLINSHIYLIQCDFQGSKKVLKHHLPFISEPRKGPACKRSWFGLWRVGSHGPKASASNEMGMRLKSKLLLWTWPLRRNHKLQLRNQQKRSR